LAGLILLSRHRRSVIGLKKKAGFKATDKKVVQSGVGQLLLQAARAVSAMSVTVGNRAMSAYKSVTSRMTASVAATEGMERSSTAGAAAAGAASSTSSGNTTTRPVSRFKPSQNNDSLGNSATAAVNSMKEDSESPGAQPAVRGPAGLPLGEGKEDSTGGSEKGEGTLNHPAVSSLKLSAHSSSESSGLQSSPAASGSSSSSSSSNASGTFNIQGMTSSEQSEEVVEPRMVRFAAAVSKNNKQSGKAGADYEDDDDSAGKKMEKCRTCDWFLSNVEGLGFKMDPWVLLLSLCISFTAIGAGIVQIMEKKDKFSMLDATGVVKVRG
jgi:hypothetical protein